MSVRKRKVKYDCVHYQRYNLCFKDYIHIRRVTFQLWLIRRLRRIKRGFSYIKLSILLIPLWGAFIVAVCYWSKYKGNTVSFGSVLWEMKSAIFTSIIVTAVTSFITQYSLNKDNYIIQHNHYINMMGTFSDLYESLRTVSGQTRKGTKPPFEPFYYSEDINEQIKGVFPKTIDPKENTANTRKALLRIEKAREIIAKMSDDVSKGKIDGCTYYEYSEQKTSCELCLNQVEDALIGDTFVPHWDIIVSGCITSLYKLLELVRIPWRRDLKYKIDVLKTIYKQDKTIADPYYLSSFLGVVDYEFYEKTTEDIIDILIKKVPALDPYEEKSHKWVNVAIPIRQNNDRPDCSEEDKEHHDQL